MATPPPPFADVRIPTLLVLGADSYLPYDHLLDAHREALGDLLEVVTVPGGHTVLWDALDETADGRSRASSALGRLAGPPQAAPAGSARRTRPRSRATSSRIATPASTSSRVIVSGGTTMTTFQCVIR